MTLRQKSVVWTWILFVAAMGLYPPWAYDQLAGDGGGNTPLTSGYHLVFTPREIGRIDMARLLVQWAVATIVAGGFYFAWPFANRGVK